DLSPSGDLLIYFAATYRPPLKSWTAISRPPWFTAIALWPKGDGWNGGGYFVGPHEIHLDHFPGEDAPHPEFIADCEKFHVSSIGRSGIARETCSSQNADVFIARLFDKMIHNRLSFSLILMATDSRRLNRLNGRRSCDEVDRRLRGVIWRLLDDISQHRARDC